MGTPPQTTRDGGRGAAPATLLIAGTSMAPTLPPGCRVRVEPAAGPLAAGDVVLLRSPSAYVVHRLVCCAEVDGRRVVFHRGDGGGRVGMADASTVIGRVLARLDEPGGALPAPAELDAGARRAFVRAAARCRAYLRARRLAERLGLARRRAPAVAAPLGALLRRLLLRA